MERQASSMLFFFFIVLLLLWPAENLKLFPGKESNAKGEGSAPCCVSSKLNVAAKKANHGRDFFRQLSTDPHAYKAITPENMCSLIHFLIQQASLNNKSVSFTKGMFVIFDSSNEIFEKLMEAKNRQQSGDESQYSGYLNRLKHMGHQAWKHLLRAAPKESDTFIYVRGDESSHFHGERGSKLHRQREYPAYGMDIPGACMPSGFGHILFGRLPSATDSGRYAGERIYIKPEFFGIRHLKQFVKHAQSYLDHVSRRYVCQIKEMQSKPGCSKEDAFRENTDKKLLEQWKTILATVPSLGEREERWIQNATKYGISEIYRQVKETQGISSATPVNEFLSRMIKQYGEEDLSVRKGREIIFTTAGLNESPLTCEFLSNTKKC